MTTNHIDQLAQWWDEAEEGVIEKGDTVINRSESETTVYVATVRAHRQHPNARILARAPKPKPAWHDAVAVMARSVFDGPDNYSGRRVMMRAGFGDDRWWDSSNEKHWEDDELADVTPLIEAKVTDEMTLRYLNHSWDAAETELHAFEEVEVRTARNALTAALGLETA